MKKIIFCFAMIMSVTLSAMVWRYDDFETGTFGDINTIDHDGDGIDWEIAETAVRAGNYHARSQSAGLTPDNQMDFPAVLVEAKSTYFAFWVGAENETDFAETYQVYLDLNGPCQPDSSILIWEETLSSAEWKYVELDISTYILENDPYAWDDNVFISIRHSGSADESALLIDDVMYLTRPWYDYSEGWSVVEEGVVEPYKDINTVWTPWDLTGWDYEGDWSFLGYKSVRLHYIITDSEGEHPEQTIDMVMNDDPDYQSSYKVTLPGMPMGTLVEYWAVTTDDSGFDITGESEHFFLEFGEINFEEGFEDEANFDPETGLPPGWVTYQLGDDQGSSWDKAWDVGTAGQNVHSGANAITSASQSNFGVWLTEDYLVSPRVRVNAEDTYLKYYVNAQTVAGEEYTERWSLLVSTVEGDGTDIENFELVEKDSIIPTADNKDTWYEKVINLAAYKDQNIRVMWVHHYTPTGEKLDRYLNLDDVSIAEMPVITVHDPGNAALPGHDVTVTATATDYSGVDNVTLYYTIDGGEEMSVVMTDNGDDTFSGVIPGQTEGAKCSYYAVVTDGSPFLNTTTSESNDIIWFESGILEWGSEGTGYTDYPEPMNSGNKAAMDYKFGTKGSLYLNKIEIGLDSDAADLKWKVVEFDGEPTEKVIGDLEGTHSFASGGDGFILEGNSTKLYGHVALVFEFDAYNDIMLDESGNKAHAWQWNNVAGWTTNSWGAFYIKMYVSQSPDDIEDQTVASTTELYQNYPNPFNPVTSIKFYNSLSGDVKLNVYNVAGEKVATLVDGKMDAGFNKVDFDASKLNSGVYYYTLETIENTITKKMVLIK